MHLRRIKLLAVLVPVIGLTAFELFRHEVVHPALGETGTHIAEHVLSAAIIIAAVLAFTFVMFGLLERLQAQLLALHEASIAVSSDLTLEGVLSRVAELAKSVTGAAHASVVIEGPRPAEVTSGIVPEAGITLSLPIVARGQKVGELILTGTSSALFRPLDRNALAVFATQAGVAIENARLFDRVQELVRARERERIGMDLHDGVVQELYGLGLKIEDATGMLAERPLQAADLLAEARAGVRGIIGDVRTYVYDLQEGDRSVDLASALGQVAREFASAPLTVTVSVPDEITLPAAVAGHIVHVAREAVANAARHAAASRAAVRAEGREDALVVEVSDDGRGFDPSSARPGMGLKDMQDRASWCNAALEVRSEPGAGTVVRLLIPLDAAREEAAG